ncbi:MAG: winged helix-turn-helix transcriptional regulator [Micromonosporaceae bacterium]|nr:winged helix-turn-helix transcriptional regulator [Micromonosporaceae bacterium]
MTTPTRGAGVEREANLLGALALVVTDQTETVTAAACGLSPTAAAALSALLHFLDKPTLDMLRRVLGLTPSGAVRLVDRLAEAGYVTRGPGADGRSRSVTLTQKGRRAAKRVARARAQVLRGALAGLSVPERETLHALLGKLFSPFIRQPRSTGWICRLCDTVSCGRDAGHCPVANEALAWHTRASTPD